MRRGILIVVALAAAALVVAAMAGCTGTYAPSGSSGGSTSSGGGTGGGTQTPGTTVDVTIENYAFSPANVEIKVGGTVTWTNKDSVDHEVTGEGWGADSPTPTGKTYSNTFDSAGTYPYHCSIHPSMTGEIVVK